MSTVEVIQQPAVLCEVIHEDGVAVEVLCTPPALVEVMGEGAQGVQGLQGPAGPIGPNTAGGTVTIDLPDGRGVLEWTETVAAVGVTPADTLAAFFAAGLDGDENNAELLDPACNPVAIAGTDEIIITATFREPISGPVKIIWKVL
jgi:hypothetical protein